MNDPRDPLLQALGDLEREHEREHPAAWEDVLAGRASASEVASRPMSGAPSEQAALSSLFTGPIPDDEIEGVVARTLAGWKAEPAPLRPVIVPLHRRGATWTGIAVVLAVAAALILWIAIPPPARGALVAYDFTVRSQSVQVQRTTDGTEVHRYRPESSIDIAITPERAVTEAIELRILARDEQGQESLLAPPVTRSPEGALRVSGRLEAVLPLAPGRWRLRLILSLPGTAPTDAGAVVDALAAGTSTTPPGSLELEVLPPETALPPETGPR